MGPETPLRPLRIWFDLTNSPHVPFFGRLIRELRGAGHDCVITCRDLANTIDLLRIEGFPYRIVGRHYGASSIFKVVGFGLRTAALLKFMWRMKADVAISHSSFYQPLVARLLGVPCIYLNDNEHAEGNRIAFAFATRIMVPEFLSDSSLRRHGVTADKLLRYPGVKEGVYLWHLERVQSRRSTRPRVFVRPEPATAQYYTGRTGVVDELLPELGKTCEVVLLPRGAAQAEHYRKPEFAGVTVLEQALPLQQIAAECDLFIGAGGTMTREAAVLGVPTISIYQDQLLDVDRYLISRGAMVHLPQLQIEDVRAHLAAVQEGAGAAMDLLEKGRQAHALIKAELLRLGDGH